MDLRSLKKVARCVNSVILLLVFGLLGFFIIIDVPFLIYFSIPTALVYLIGFVLIEKNMLDVYVRIVYFWITLYMSITTLCLGYEYGFHLYCFSMIPIIFVTEYMSYKLNNNRIYGAVSSALIAVLYLVCTGYVLYNGPLYQRSSKMASVFWFFNAVIVFSFLIFYSSYLIKEIILSEEKLKEIAHVDRLTGSYNRHYMIEKLDEFCSSACVGCLAMADIDNFKKINDTYGHSAGDKVLKKISDDMREICVGCEISRWGGEEFLILSDGEFDRSVELFSTLCQKISESPVCFDDIEIYVTITVGLARFYKDIGIDRWIKQADDNLYEGKRTGKNKVVYQN